METIFDDLSRAISTRRPRREWTKAARSLSLELAFRLATGLAIGVGMAVGLALAEASDVFREEVLKQSSP